MPSTSETLVCWSAASRHKSLKWQTDRDAEVIDEADGRAPTMRSGDAPRPDLLSLPAYIERALRANPTAWGFFEQLAPSYRRGYVAWIDSAKKDVTLQRRLSEVLERLAAGQKPGLK